MADFGGRHSLVRSFTGVHKSGVNSGERLSGPVSARPRRSCGAPIYAAILRSPSTNSSLDIPRLGMNVHGPSESKLTDFQRGAMKEYKVMSQKDKWFSSKFDPENWNKA